MTFKALERMVMLCRRFGSRRCLLGDGVLLFDSSVLRVFWRL